MAVFIIGVTGGLPQDQLSIGAILGVIIGRGGAWVDRHYIEKQKDDAVTPAISEKQNQNTRQKNCNNVRDGK